MSTIKASTKLVKPHFSLVLKQEQKNLIDFILDELKDLSVESLMLDPDFLKYICELIENQVCTVHSDPAVPKSNKMNAMVEILKRLFPQVSDAELEPCKVIVEFILKNKLVKKIPVSEVFKFYLKKTIIRCVSFLYNSSNNLLYSKYVTNMLKSNYYTSYMLTINNCSQSNMLQNYVLYPVLMSVIHHKVAVLIILAFI